MPAAAKLMADNNLPAGSVPGTGKDGRVTKDDVLGAVAGGAKPASIPTGVPTASLPQVSGPAAPDLGSRPKQRRSDAIDENEFVMLLMFLSSATYCFSRRSSVHSSYSLKRSA